MKLRAIIALLFCSCAALGAQDAAPLPQGRQSVRIIQTPPPVFPLSLRNTGVRNGQARVVISIDHTGQLVDWLVISYSRHEFADATLDAIKKWRYEPMRLNGEPRAAQVEITINFEQSGIAVVRLDLGTYVTMRFEEVMGAGSGYRPCTLAEIDRIPTPVTVVQPAYSEADLRRNVRGEAVVAFFIDEAGSVRMPALVSADHEDLGVLAVNALTQWKFEPATRNGRPVLVRAQQVFNFGK